MAFLFDNPIVSRIAINAAQIDNNQAASIANIEIHGTNPKNAKRRGELAYPIDRNIPPISP
jgi:hypothetical protein